jgi:hypothetical protein
MYCMSPLFVALDFTGEGCAYASGPLTAGEKPEPQTLSFFFVFSFPALSLSMWFDQFGDTNLVKQMLSPDPPPVRAAILSPKP